MMNCSRRLLAVTEPLKKHRVAKLVAGVGALLSISSVAGSAPGPSQPQGDAITVVGTVWNSAGRLLEGASVLLEEKAHSNSCETKTKVDGSFVFSAVRPGVYTVRVRKSGWREGVSNPMVLTAGDKKRVDLVLESLTTDHPGASGSSSSSGSAAGAVDFDDKPNFTVAGVTDWNNTGMHGSDVNARTSEALAKEMLALKDHGLADKSAADTKAVATSPNSGETEQKLRGALEKSPQNFEANHQLGELYFRSKRYREAIPLLEAAYRINPANQANAYDLALAYRTNGEYARAVEQARKMLANADTADVHRLLGELNERSGDPLEAVREYERAARLDPSEENYFEWGTELLLHRADQPAVEVLTKGSSAHPDSVRMLAGLGAALYADGHYEAAAGRLCEASDLNPADPAPYLFLGRMEKAAPALLPCGEQKLARFVRNQPGNALANYYYGITLWKRDRGSENSVGLQRAESFLEKAVTIDPRLGEAYLQLGILHSERGSFEQAIGDYKKAIEASPQLGEAHYRLGLAYRRTKEESKAEQEFRAYEQMEKAETAAIEGQRRELRQFLIILKDQPAASSPR